MTLNRRQLLRIAGVAGAGSVLVPLFQNFSHQAESVSIQGLGYSINPSTGRPVVANVQALKGLSELRRGRQQVEVSGFYNSGDGGGGLFVWNPQTSLHDGGIFVNPNVVPSAGAEGWWSAKSSSAGTWERQFSSSSVNVNWYGIFADNQTNWTKAFHFLSLSVSSLGLGIYLPGPGVYRSNYIRIYSGTERFVCEGVIRNAGQRDANGLLQLDGPKFNKGVRPPVADCFIKVNLDMSGGDVFGIQASQCHGCIFSECNISGFTESALERSTYKYGILLADGSSGNQIIKNKILGYFNPHSRHMLIDCLGNSLPEGGYFANKGQVSRASQPAKKNVIRENLCINGSYAVILGGAESCEVIGNTFKNQNHRGVYLGPASFYNKISSNSITGYKSTGVLLCKGSSQNEISGNIFSDGDRRFPASDEASINLNTGASFNRIVGNRIDSERTFGIYLACGVRGNLVENNDIRGFNRVGIGLESDWSRPLPSGAKYSRSNFVAPTDAEKAWAFLSTENNTIMGNKISSPKPFQGKATCGIYVAQINGPYPGVKNRNNIIVDNEISGNLTHYAYFFEAAPGAMSGIKFVRNKFSTNNRNKFFSSRGGGPFSEYQKVF